MLRASGADVSSIEYLCPRLNLRRSTRVGAWNVMLSSEVRDELTSQRECHLTQTSAELNRSGVSEQVISETKRPGSVWISGGGHKYFWSGRHQWHLAGLAVAIADQTGLYSH